MQENHLTCIPKGTAQRRDPTTCLIIVFRDMFSIGLLPQYPFTKKGAKPKPKTPENIQGYNMMIPLAKDVANPTEKEAKIQAMLKAFHKAAQKYILANKSSLPTVFKALDDDKLKKCVQPIETPSMTKTVDGKEHTYAPTLYGKIGYFKEAKAGTERNQTDKDRPEKFTTVFRLPNRDIIADPKTLVKAVGVSTTGIVTFALRVNHLNFLTGDGEDTSLKIKFDTEVVEVVYNKTAHQEVDYLSDYITDSGDDQSSLLAEYNNRVDPTKSYGDAASTYKGADDESDSSAEKVEKPKKKSTPEEKPAKKKKRVEE
jgi:hypothetical protein